MSCRPQGTNRESRGEGTSREGTFREGKRREAQERVGKSIFTGKGAKWGERW